MEIRTVSLSSFRARQAWDPVWPLRPEFFAELEKRLPGWPLLVMDGAGRLIFALDHLARLRSQGVRRAGALVLEVAPAEALLLAGQLRRSLAGMNLYEKLVWVKRLSEHLEPADIQRRADPGFAVDPELLAELPRLLAAEFRPALAGERIGLRAGRRLPGFSRPDRRRLLSLFMATHFSESHQGIVLNLVEEVGFARGWSLRTVFGRIGAERLLRERQPAAAVVDALTALRYPGTAALEREWRRRVRELKLPEGARLSHAPFFESKALDLQVRVDGWEQLERLLAGLKSGGEC